MVIYVMRALSLSLQFYNVTQWLRGGEKMSQAYSHRVCAVSLYEILYFGMTIRNVWRDHAGES